MARTARVWIGEGREPDEEFYFEGSFEFHQKLKDVRARRQIGVYSLRLHGEERTPRTFRLPEGNVELDMVPWTAQDEEDAIAAEEQKQREHEAQRSTAERIQEIRDRIQLKIVEEQDRMNEAMALARARRLAEERERSSKLELDFAQYMAVFGEYFNSLGVVASQCFGSSMHGIHSIREHCE